MKGDDLLIVTAISPVASDLSGLPSAYSRPWAFTFPGIWFPHTILNTSSSLCTPCIFQAHIHTWGERPSAFLHDWNIFKTEEPLNQWNKACWLKNISHALFFVVLPMSTKLNIYRSEHFQPLLESCSQKCLFKWSSVNSLGSFMSFFAGTHISPREISVSEPNRGPAKTSQWGVLALFPKCFLKNVCLDPSSLSWVHILTIQLLK